MRTFSLIAYLMLAVPSFAAAEDALDATRLIHRYEFGDLEWSADGQQLAVVVTEPVSEEGQAKNIWLYDVGTDRLRQLTRSDQSHRHPRWSPDDKTLAYLSLDSEKKTRLFALPMNGGEAEPLALDAAEVVDFAWSPDGNTIAFTAEDSPVDTADAELVDKDDEVVASELVKPVRLWLLDLESGTTLRLTHGNWRVSGFAWQPDGNALIVAASDDPSVEQQTERLLSVSRDGENITELARPDGPFEKLSASPDSRFIAYIGSSDGGPIPHSLFLQSIEDGEVKNLTGDTMDRLITDYGWASDDSLWVLVANGFGNYLAQVSIAGDIQEQPGLTGWSIAALGGTGGRTAFIGESGVEPQELWIRDATSDRQVSHLNGKFPTMIEPQLIRYGVDGGLEIEAALFEPVGMSRPAKGWKTVLLIHGGPAGRWSNRINDWAQMLVAQGFAVLAPNIRGSVGYGLTFVRSNRHDWGGADYRDSMAGLDLLIEQGITDPDRTAIAGWSYGGYMAAWAITQTDRFKAAVVGAAMTDLAVEYGTELAEINAYDTWYLGTPYANLDSFIQRSPMTFVSDATTPALILVGENDEIDPVGQSRQFYRGLRRYGVETELVTYPREPHQIKELHHRIDVLARMAAWIDVHTR